MSERGPTVGGLGERTLSLVASVVHGAPVTVILTSRAEGGASLALESRTVALDPERTGPYDLLLLAGMLRHRREALGRKGDAAPSSREVARWVKEERDALERAFPGVSRLPGRWAPDRPGGGGGGRGGLFGRAGRAVPPPRVTRREVEMAPLGGGTLAGDVETAQVVGTSMRGVEGDVAELIEGLRSGRVTTKRHPSLTEMPYVEVPVRLRLPARPTGAGLLDRPDRKEIDEAARGILTCFENHIRGMAVTRYAPPRTFGTRLDPAALHEAYVATKAGRAPRAFRKRPKTLDPTFQPDRHLAVLGLDVGTFYATAERKTRASLNFLGIFARVLQMLELDLAIVGFRDRILDLGDGRKVYLHMPCVAKEVGEPFTESTWERIHALWGPSALGAPACFLPLQVERLARMLREARDAGDYRYVRLDHYATAGFGREYASYEHAARLAAAADRPLVELRDEAAAAEIDWETGLFVPQALIDAAPRDGVLKTAGDLGL